jgi:hypothetical protein
MTRIRKLPGWMIYQAPSEANQFLETYGIRAQTPESMPNISLLESAKGIGRNYSRIDVGCALDFASTVKQSREFFNEF